jgi:hypothetical protein
MRVNCIKSESEFILLERIVSLNEYLMRLSGQSLEFASAFKEASRHFIFIFRFKKEG